MKIIDSYLRCAFEAAKSKKALDLLILDVRKLAQFTDFFILCSGTSVPQIQAISNEVEEQLKKKVDANPNILKVIEEPSGF